MKLFQGFGSGQIWPSGPGSLEKCEAVGVAPRKPANEESGASECDSDYISSFGPPTCN